MQNQVKFELEGQIQKYFGQSNFLLITMNATKQPPSYDPTEFTNCHVLEIRIKMFKGDISPETDKDTKNFIEKYLENIDYPYKSDYDAESYVSHPINAFHLMKRTSNWLSRIKHQFENRSQNWISTKKDEVRVFYILTSEWVHFLV